eukprot:12789411-Alexandrium_andersonii.AAC.1
MTHADTGSSCWRTTPKGASRRMPCTTQVHQMQFQTRVTAILHEALPAASGARPSSKKLGSTAA